MNTYSIRNTLAATALAAVMGVFSTFPAVAGEDVDADSYFNFGMDAAELVNSAPIEEASVQPHIQEAMEIN